MVLNIKISEDQILGQDTSVIRKELDGVVQSSLLIKKHENNISIIFQGLTPFDILNKLKHDEYKMWFKKLDAEIPGLPYFLNEESNSLLFFLMGNISYEKKEASVQFDKIEASRFFKEKVIQMRNLCLPHNINPQTGMIRISNILSGEKEKNGNKTEISGVQTTGSSDQKSGDQVESEKKKGAIKDFLDSYGSIAFLNNDRTVKLTLVLNEIPSKISFVRNFLVKDPSFPQQVFLTVLQTDTGISEIKSLILANTADVEASIEHNKGVYVQVVTKSDDGTYQMLFESSNVFAITVTTSLLEDLKKIELDSGMSFKNEEILPKKNQPLNKTDNTSPDEEVSAESQSAEKDELYSLNSDIILLRKKNEALVEKVTTLEKLIEVYEEEINKKRSIGGFFRKFFS